MNALRAVWEEARAGEGRGIRALRKRLKLSQVEAGRIFGGGANAFSRYERGKAQPPKSTVILLKLLSRRPELLRELENADNRVNSSRKFFDIAKDKNGENQQR